MRWGNWSVVCVSIVESFAMTSFDHFTGKFAFTPRGTNAFSSADEENDEQKTTSENGRPAQSAINDKLENGRREPYGTSPENSGKMSAESAGKQQKLNGAREALGAKVKAGKQARSHPMQNAIHRKNKEKLQILPAKIMKTETAHCSWENGLMCCCLLPANSIYRFQTNLCGMLQNGAVVHKNMKQLSILPLAAVWLRHLSKSRRQQFLRL